MQRFMGLQKPQFSLLKPFFLCFILTQTLIRIALLSREWSNLDHSITLFLQSLFMGTLFDLVTFSYLMLPISLILLTLPASWHEPRKSWYIKTPIFGIFAFIMYFTAIAEWLFWDEFSTRFNFIAVDYLIYMDEVVGNIRESYPLPLLLSLIGVAAFASAVVYGLTQKPHAQAIIFSQRISLAAASLAFMLVSLVAAQDRYSEFNANRYANEGAKNGIYSLFAAFMHNELDYASFYRTEDNKEVLARLREHLVDNDTNERLVSNQWNDITYHVDNQKIDTKPNLVLIMVESLSADYLKTFGNTQNLTPHLDALIDKSLFFTNLYATGTRTVYGLSAVTLSMPPIPGNAIVRRPNNDNLFSLASVLNRQGYESSFIYGGYGYFDNMNTFFSGNGYHIIDRSELTPDESEFTNIWGVADEGLFRRVLRENDKAYQKGTPFFQMVMTTSNHRPFTYPDGRIDIPSHTGRFGGVKYTDYAINAFLEEAQTKPWFDNTIFVIVADHTAGSAGKSELDPAKYHIPFWVYAPKWVKPGKVNELASQIDVTPTVLGLMDISYNSRFYGQDILRNPPKRAFISNYQKLGYLTENTLTILKPRSEVSYYVKEDNQWQEAKKVSNTDIDNAIMYFQSASNWQRLSKDLGDNEVQVSGIVDKKKNDVR